DAARQHAHAVDRTLEQWQKPKRALEHGKQMLAQPRHHDKDSPKAQDDARNRREQFDEDGQRLADPLRGQFGEEYRRGDAQRYGDAEGYQGGNQGAEDEGQGAELVVDRIPFRAPQKTPAKLLDGMGRSTREFIADEDDQRKDRQRHQER